MRIVLLTSLFLGMVGPDCGGSSGDEPNRPPQHSMATLSPGATGTVCGELLHGRVSKCAAPFVDGHVLDAEHDRVRLEVEVVRAGTSFQEVATVSSAFDASYSDETDVMKTCVTLPGLESGQAYRVALRLVEEGGAASSWVEACSDGTWIAP